jgi:hypothetical protein
LYFIYVLFHLVDDGAQFVINGTASRGHSSRQEAQKAISLTHPLQSINNQQRKEKKDGLPAGAIGTLNTSPLIRRLREERAPKIERRKIRTANTKQTK